MMARDKRFDNIAELVSIPEAMARLSIGRHKAKELAVESDSLIIMSERLVRIDYRKLRDYITEKYTATVKA